MKFFFSTKIKLLLLLSSTFLMSFLSAQNNFNSAYSRYGLGLLEAPGTFSHFGMGGLNTAISDPFVINFSNPGSYSFLDMTTLQVSGKGGSSTLDTKDATSKESGGQINELGLGFKKPGGKWAFVVGVTPYSKIDYRFTSTKEINDSLTSKFTYDGAGGLNKAVLGSSRLFKFGLHKANSDSLSKTRSDSTNRMVHQLAIGANLNYVFGNINRESVVSFSTTPFLNTYNVMNVWARGFFYEVGLLYKVNLTTKRDDQKRIVGGTLLQLGADYVLDARLSSSFTELSTSIGNISGKVVSDTVQFIENEKGKLKIPQRISVGAALKMYNIRTGTLTVGLDYRTQDWSKYQLNTASDAQLDKGLKSTTALSFGLEYKPSMDQKTDFLHRITYRAGYRTSESALYINETQVIQKGVSAGITIPVIKSSSKFHIGAEYGTNGTIENGLVKETYLNFQVGLTLTPSAFDRWFRQTKYD
jgi:hypothetical protein